MMFDGILHDLNYLAFAPTSFTYNMTQTQKGNLKCTLYLFATHSNYTKYSHVVF